jgi:hypothetical protein
MSRRFLLFILLVYSNFLFSAEVTLRSENIFICEVIEENPDNIVILFKDHKFKIPRSEIQEINHDITGKHISYQNTVLTLKDGSIVKGQLAEETLEMITIKKGDDLLAIPRDTISNYKKWNDKQYSLPESYRVLEKEKPASNWNLGFYGVASKNTNKLGESNYASYGGGLFIEPSFLKVNERWLFGFQSEFLSSGGRLTYSFIQNFFYVQFNQILFGFNVYCKVGIGTSYITLTENDQSANALKGAGTFEGGWQNSLSDKTILRVGIRGNAIYEKPLTLEMIGMQISVGYRL